MPRIFMTNNEKALLDRIWNYRKHIFNIIDNRIKNHNPDDNDIISHMIRGKEITKDLKEDVLHQYFTFVFAGTHATSNFTTMAVYYLAKYPNV